MRVIITAVALGVLCITARINAQTLDDYLQEAAENNPGLRAAFTTYEAALQRIPQVNALPDPTLSFGYFISPAETRVGPQNLRLSLSQALPWFGVLAAQENVASRQAEVEYQTYINARNTLYFKVKTAYYALYELQRHIILEREYKDVLLSYKELATTRLRNGKGALADVIRTDILIDNSDTEISVLEAKRSPREAAFNRLLDRDEEKSINIPENLEIVAIPDKYRKDSLLVRNPQLNAFDLKIRSARARQNVAEKQGFPRLGFGLDYIVVGNRTDIDVRDNGKDVVMPMLSLSIPMFRGKYNAAVEEAKLHQAALADSKIELRNTLLADYEMAWYELERSRQLIDLYSGQIIKARQMHDLLIKEYGVSGADFEEALRMQRELLKFRMAEVVAQKEFFIALAKLDYLTAK